MNELSLTPTPQQIETIESEIVSLPSLVSIDAPGEALADIRRMLADDLTRIAGIAVKDAPPATFPVRLNIIKDELRPPESYVLTTAKDGVTISGGSRAGVFYGCQTLLQLAALNGRRLPAMTITDAPRYTIRELMVDMGRAPYSFTLLKRIVRIMARLKLNTLHLHLFDDQLNSLKFNTLPLGSENPWALMIEELGELVEYAKRYFVRIVPELEAWGHAGSILYHYPELHGGPGMWEGFSFGIGEELYELFEKIVDEVVAVLDDECDVHFGLDEAVWALLPSVSESDKSAYSPESHVGRLYDILQRAGEKHGKRCRMRIWADHGGRPVPEAIRDSVIVEPWQYFESRENDILEKLGKFGGKGKPPFICGGGMSSLHLLGGYGATRIWAQAAKDFPNVEGVDICLWESNAIADHLLGIFAGADYIWTPDTPAAIDGDTFNERLTGRFLVAMKKWQAAFDDASDSAIRSDTGFPVYRGVYEDGPLKGRYVAPTVPLVSPRDKSTETQ